MLKASKLNIIVAATFVGVTSFAAQSDEKLGKLSFSTSCNPAVQSEIERGVAMLHSFWFYVAGRVFRGVIDRDPNCAIAYWGVAADLLNNILVGPPSSADADQAWDALEKANMIGAKTERERDWINTLRIYYSDRNTKSVDQRIAAYNAAMEQLALKYPDDDDAQVFYALTLQASAPTTDTTYANQLKSAAILKRIYDKNPLHPGVTHFTIHAYDFEPLAKQGIPAARLYANLAPAVPHARHMPSHIYTMLGMWEDSIASNASALEVQQDYFHAADFSVYAHLQLAQDAKAKALIDKTLSTPDQGDRPIAFTLFTAKSAMPARYVLERADWQGAALLPVVPSTYPAADAITYFTRGFGMARLGDLAGAKAEVEMLTAIRDRLLNTNQHYWADRSDEQIFAIMAWVKLREGDRAKAITLMQAAADGEDKSIKNVAMENRLYPFRELLGELYYELGDWAAAKKQFDIALKQTPNRFRALLGAARSAQQLGDTTEAMQKYLMLIELTKQSDTERAEIREAKTYLQGPRNQK